MSLFLFGRVYQEHWKTVQGTVLALLNPSIMPDKEVRHLWGFEGFDKDVAKIF